MANPIQQGLKHQILTNAKAPLLAAMANPIQQGLKPPDNPADTGGQFRPQWLIQYNTD